MAAETADPEALESLLEGANSVVADASQALDSVEPLAARLLCHDALFAADGAAFASFVGGECHALRALEAVDSSVVCPVVVGARLEAQ